MVATASLIPSDLVGKEAAKIRPEKPSQFLLIQ